MVDVDKLKGILVDCEEHVILHRDELADLLREREELIEALDYVTRSFQAVIKSDYETHSNPEPWKNEESWQQATTLLARLKEHHE